MIAHSIPKKTSVSIRTVGNGATKQLRSRHLQIFGYDEITQQYFDRYRLPVMHTETNHAQGEWGTDAVDWLWKQWANILCTREQGLPILGFTLHFLTDQVDWDTALREEN